jgi:hypothetical protein
MQVVWWAVGLFHNAIDTVRALPYTILYQCRYTCPTLTLGTTTPQQFSATVYNQLGDPMSPQPAFVWSVEAGGVGSIDYLSGLYHSGPTAGSATIKVTGGGLSATVAVTVNLTPVTVVNPAAATPNPAPLTMTNLSALGGYARTGGESALTYTWAETSGPDAVTYSANGTHAARNTIATFATAGTYQFTVTIASPVGSSTTSSVTVTVDQTVTSIDVTPGPTVTLASPLPQTQQFTATALDQFGNTMASQPTFIWTIAVGSVGSIGYLDGLYHTGAVAGSATVVAKSGVVSGSSAITVAILAYSVLHDFGGTVINAGGASGPDGSYPYAGVTFDSAGNMYGTTSDADPNGTSLGDGMVWEITASGTYKDLHDFGGTVVNAGGTVALTATFPMPVSRSTAPVICMEQPRAAAPTTADGITAACCGRSLRQALTRTFMTLVAGLSTPTERTGRTAPILSRESPSTALGTCMVQLRTAARTASPTAWYGR